MLSKKQNRTTFLIDKIRENLKIKNNENLFEITLKRI